MQLKGRIGRPSSPVIFCALAVGLSLFISVAFQPRALGNALADDALFIRLATQIAEGNWLGTYDEMTLVKGAFYPAFIASVYHLAVPLLVGQQVLVIIVSGVAAFVLHRMGLPRLWALALFVVLSLNPLPWHPDLLRVTREPLYASLGVMVIALAALVLFDRGMGPRARVFLSVVLGLCFGGFWLTREESLWLYPSLLLLGGVAVFSGMRTGSGFKPTLVSLALVLAGFAVSAGTVAALNVTHYGSFLTNEVREGEMARAYGALMRVNQDAPVPRVFFSADAARRAYDASPSARELEPSLSGERGAFWRRIGCEALNLDPCPSGFGGGWFMWAFRDAVKAAGHMDDAASAQAFFHRLADEINAACAAGKIACAEERASMAPSMTWGDVLEVPARAWRAASLLLRFGEGKVGPPDSEGGQEQIAAFEKMVGPVSRPNRGTGDWVIEGWVAAPTCVPQPFVVDGSGVRSARSHKISDAPDVVSFLEARGQTAKALRFKITTACQDTACRLVLEGCDAQANEIPLAVLKTGLHPNADAAVVFLDRVERAPEAGAGNGAGGFAVFASGILAAFYSSLVMPAFIAAFGLFVFSMYRFRDINPMLAAIAAAALVAVVVRAVLIAVIDVTSWDAINLQYMMPAAPFVLVFTVVGSWLGWSAFRGRTPSVGKAQN